MKMFRRKSSVVLFVLIACFMLLSFKDTPDGQIVCFGDSITYGANVDGHSWVWYLSKQHPAVDFINAGRSGRKTSDKGELLPVVKKYPSAKYYLIFLGVNDLKDGSDSMVNNCISNMTSMIGTIRDGSPGAKIVILSPTDINVKTMSEINVQKKYNQNTHRSLVNLQNKYRELASQEHIGFISLLHAVSKANYVDGLHPNEEGQQQIAHTVWKKLNRLH